MDSILLGTCSFKGGALKCKLNLSPWILQNPLPDFHRYGVFKFRGSLRFTRALTSYMFKVPCL